MDYYDPLNPDFASQEAQLATAQARIKALRGLAPVTAGGVDHGWTSAVTGTRVAGRQPKQSILGALIPAIGDFVADNRQKDFDEQRGRLSAAERENLAGWIAATPQAKTVTPYAPTNAPSEENPGGNLVEAAPSGPGELVQPTDADQAAHVAAGLRSGNPLIDPIANKAAADAVIQAPIRAEAAALKLQTQQNVNQQKALDRMTQLQRDRDNAAGKMDRLRLQLATVPAGTAESNMIRREALSQKREQDSIENEIKQRQLEINGQKADAAVTKASAPGKMSDKQIEAQMKNAATVSGLGTVLNNMSDTMFNPALHSERTQALGANSSDPQDQKDSSTWAQYRSIANQIRNSLYGSALTAHEQAAFDSTSIDTLTGKAQAVERVKRMQDLARIGIARLDAMKKGGEMDPDTGEVIMPDGSVARGTQSTVPGAPRSNRPVSPATRSALPLSTGARNASERVAPAAQAARDDEAANMIEMEIKNLPASDPAVPGLQRELARLRGKRVGIPMGTPQGAPADAPAAPGKWKIERAS